MMKRTFIQLFSMICAIYFLIAGAGFNFVRYCCDSCAREGIDAVVSKSCADIHHNYQHEGESCCLHNHNTPSYASGDMVCSDIAHKADGCCHLYRIQIDIPSIHAVKSVQSDQYFTIDFQFPVLDLLFVENTSDKKSNPFPLLDDIPFWSGRDILAYHAVLLI